MVRILEAFEKVLGEMGEGELERERVKEVIEDVRRNLEGIRAVQGE